MERKKQSLRVVAGKYKRTKLDSLDSLKTRPTKDMVKEALFSSIYIENESNFLDLFAGSGAIGIEALSRGAKKVVFNDNNHDACKIIKQNLAKIKEDVTVYNLDYKECLKRLDKDKFDYVYVDPPYAFDEYVEVFKLLLEYELLNDEAIIIVEVKKDVDLDENIFNFSKYKEKKYGISKLLYYRRNDV